MTAQDGVGQRRAALVAELQDERDGHLFIADYCGGSGTSLRVKMNC